MTREKAQANLLTPHRSSIMRTLFLLIIFTATALHAADPAPTGHLAKPNVVILFTDDQGTLDANCYGSTDLYTPAMDELAATGVRFTQAYAHKVCCPSRAMLMTGRYPQRGGVSTWTQPNAKAEKGRNMALEEITLAETLKEAGYNTGLFGKWHLGAHLDHGPTKQGFDEFIGLRGGFVDNYNHYFLHNNGFHDLYEGTQEIFAKDTYFPDMVTNRALQFIDKHKDAPFFAYVAFNIPHYPEQPDKKFDKRYQDLKEPRRSYAKMISTVDDHMGRILGRLEQHGHRDNTIVIFMSDNGHATKNYKIKRAGHSSGLAEGSNYGANGGGGNTGKWIGKKGTFLEGGIRVPAILSYPAALPKGVVRGQAVTAMDWMPTILELCNVPTPEAKLDGGSLVPIIKSATAKTHYTDMHWQWGNKWAVRQGDWKLQGSGNKGLTLHTLRGELPERKNYFKEKPELAAQLLALHQAWEKDVQPKHR